MSLTFGVSFTITGMVRPSIDPLLSSAYRQPADARPLAALAMRAAAEVQLDAVGPPSCRLLGGFRVRLGRVDRP